MKTFFKNKKGITLVALVILIIVMIVLAVVTIRIIQMEGIIPYAQESSDEYTKQQKREEYKLYQNEYIMYINETGDTILLEDYILRKKYGLKMGDKINYNCLVKEDGTSVKENNLQYVANAEQSGSNTNQTFSVIKNPTWVVIGVDDEVNILIAPDTVTDGKLTLKGLPGYNNAVTILDDISKMYGFGKGAKYSRSITATDINDITGYDPTKYDSYGKEYTYKGNWNYFITESGELVRLTNNKVTIKQAYTSYSYKYIHPTNGNLLLRWKGYWVATPMVWCNSDVAFYGISRWYYDNIWNVQFVANTNNPNEWNEGNFAVRPVVGLLDNIQLEKVGEKNGQVEYNIK